MRLENTAESPVQLFNRRVSATTREWPLLAYPTRFDLGNARVVSLDVAALCGDMTPVGQRQTAIAYLLALHVLSHDLFMDPQTAPIVPVRYQTYHRDRVEALLATPKKICIDEKHRCGGLRAVDAQIVRFMREGRKANVHIALASQMLDNFTAEMAELATTIYIMEYTSDDGAEAVRAKFSLSASAMRELRVHGTGTTPAGAPFLGVFRTERRDAGAAAVPDPRPHRTVGAVDHGGGSVGARPAVRTLRAAAGARGLGARVSGRHDQNRTPAPVG